MDAQADLRLVVRIWHKQVFYTTWLNYGYANWHRHVCWSLFYSRIIYVISCFNVYADVTCVCSCEYGCGAHMLQCGIITMQNNVSYNNARFKLPV